MKKKFYVVWEGRQTGIFDSWAECEKQVKGFKGAQYKSFKTLYEAQKAWQGSAVPVSSPEPTACSQPILESICVDGAYSSKTHIGEYQGVFTKTGEKLFHQGPFPDGSNNLMEFLAIVHALALCHKNSWNLPIYSDSRTAILWVQQKNVHTTIERNAENEVLFRLIERAIRWLETHPYENPLLKWDTTRWGENPADFNRKSR